MAQSMRGGSPLGEYQNLNSVGGSPAYEREPAGQNIRKAQEFPSGMIVTLFDNAKENVAEGVGSAVGVGEWLEEDRLRPRTLLYL